MRKDNIFLIALGILKRQFCYIGHHCAFDATEVTTSVLLFLVAIYVTFKHIINLVISPSDKRHINRFGPKRTGNSKTGPLLQYQILIVFEKMRPLLNLWCNGTF